MTKRILTSIVALVSSLLSISAASGDESKPAVSALTDNPLAVTFPGLERYTDLQGFYSVLLRDGPDKKSQIDVSGRKCFEIVDEDKSGIWSVCWTDLPKEEPPFLPTGPRILFRNLSRAYFDRFAGNVEKDATDKRFGYELRIMEGPLTKGQWKGGRLRLNAYLAGRRMFIACVAGKDDWANSSASVAFLNSFEVPGAAASPKDELNLRKGK